jgi:hypothetical protein
MDKVYVVEQWDYSYRRRMVCIEGVFAARGLAEDAVKQLTAGRDLDDLTVYRIMSYEVGKLVDKSL